MVGNLKGHSPMPWPQRSDIDTERGAKLCNLSITANDLFPIVGNMVAGRGEAVI